MTLPYYVLTGPTASGKTAWLVTRAHSHRLLAISADSRQVYRHMDIGTGKPTFADREILPHQGLDCLEINKNFSAYQFLDMAIEGLVRARAEGREAWICGGTGLYIRALVEGLALGLPPRPILRAAVEYSLTQSGARAVADLLRLDVPDQCNPVRVARYTELACADPDRAREVYRALGLDPQLAQGEGQPESEVAGRAAGIRAELSRWHCAGIAVLDPGPALAQRIVERTVSMFTAGLVDEVARIRALGFGDCAVVRNGIGYREAGQVLDGEMTVAEAIQRTIIRTRQYAKRQRTYFRGQGWSRYTPAHVEDALHLLV